MDCLNLVTSMGRLVLSDLGKHVVTELRSCKDIYDAVFLLLKN